MVWYGMVWYGMAWFGVVRYGLVWYGMVWCGMVWKKKKKMGEDAESDFAIPFVDENDYSEISAKAVSAKPKLKKNRPFSLV